MKNLKTYLLASASVVTLVGTAIAADLPIKTSVPAVPYVADTWTGAYLGGFIGVGSHQATCNIGTYGVYGGCNDNDVSPPGNATVKGTSFLGGFDGGYDWQLDRNFVMGVAADWTWTNGLKGTAYGGSGSVSYSSKVNWLASFRGRMGLAVDNTMVYATGGVALGSFNDTVMIGTSSQYSTSNIPVGWVAGFGVEHKFNQHWSINAEYRYYDFPTYSVSHTQDAEQYTHQFAHTLNVLQAGFRYRF